MPETQTATLREILLRAEKIGLLELNIQAISSILERYQEELAQEKAIVHAYYRQGPSGLPPLREPGAPQA